MEKYNFNLDRPFLFVIENGIPEEKATMVVIPTIVKTSEKVKELMKKLEEEN